MYAKLNNNMLRRAPNKVIHNNRLICNPKEDILLELGYMPVVYTQMPTDAPEGQHYASSWKQEDGQILQVWTLADDPELPEEEETMADLAEAVERGLNS